MTRKIAVFVVGMLASLRSSHGTANRIAIAPNITSTPLSLCGITRNIA